MSLFRFQWAVATAYYVLLAQYVVDRGFGGGNIAASFDDNIPGTPAWQEKITGVPRHDVIEIAREFARTADKTRGRSMIIVGAGMNHWFHNDMNYRGLINMLVMCGCRSEEHTSELQSLMRSSYAVFCLTKNKQIN